MAERVRGPRAVVGARSVLVLGSAALVEPKLARYFSGMAGRVARGGKSWESVPWEGGPGLKAGPSISWSRERKLLTSILKPLYETVGEATFGIVSDQVRTEVVWDLNSREVRKVLGEVANRVTQINDASKRMIRELVASEIERGSNADRLQDQLRTLCRSWAGLSGPVSMSEEDRRRLSRAEAQARSRAHAIALTESGNAYNRASVEGYRASGLVTQVIVYDGDDCGWSSHDDPDLANRSTRTLNEAAATPLSHPHCQRAFGPQVQRTRR